jgi:hypothetical protein
VSVLRVQKQPILFDTIDSAPHRIADSHAAVSKEQNERTEPLCVSGSGRLGVEVDRRQNLDHLRLRIGQSRPDFRFRRLQSFRGILLDPLSISYKVEKCLHPLEFLGGCPRT